MARDKKLNWANLKNFDINAYDKGYSRGFLEVRNNYPPFNDVTKNDIMGDNGYMIGYTDGSTMGAMELKLIAQQKKCDLFPNSLEEQDKLTSLQKEWEELAFVRNGFEARVEKRWADEFAQEKTSDTPEEINQKELDEIRLDNEKEHDTEERDLGE